MKKSSTLFIPFIFSILFSSSLFAQTELGLNVNGGLNSAGPHRHSDIDHTGARWIRGFVRALEYIDGNKNLATDPELAAFLETAKNKKYKTVLSVRWDHKKNDLRLPANGSDRMRTYVRFVNDLLSLFGPHIDKFVVSNEPMWETQRQDRVFDQSRKINPSVVFHKRLANIAKDWRKNYGANFDIYVGSFNRLDKQNNASFDDVIKMINFAKNTAWVKGIDLHAHHLSVSQLEENVAKAREMLGNSKDIIMTEYSLVWRWNKNRMKPIPQGFAREYSYPSNLKFLDYLNRAQINPVSKSEWNTLFSQLDWWVPNFHKQVYQIGKKYKIGVTNYAFGSNNSLPPRRAKKPIGPNTNMYYLNGLFQGRFVQTNAAGQAQHAFIFHYFSSINKNYTH